MVELLLSWMGVLAAAGAATLPLQLPSCCNRRCHSSCWAVVAKVALVLRSLPRLRCCRMGATHGVVPRLRSMLPRLTLSAPTHPSRPAAVPFSPCSMKGVPELQTAMARLLERFLLPGFSVNPSQLCISAGELPCLSIGSILAACSMEWWAAAGMCAACCGSGHAGSCFRPHFHHWKHGHRAVQQGLRAVQTDSPCGTPPLPGCLGSPPPTGCTAIIDNLIYALCDEGDGVLIPAPYYPAFDNDLQASGSGDAAGGSALLPCA